MDLAAVVIREFLFCICRVLTLLISRCDGFYFALTAIVLLRLYTVQPFNRSTRYASPQTVCTRASRLDSFLSRPDSHSTPLLSVSRVVDCRCTCVGQIVCHVAALKWRETSYFRWRVQPPQARDGHRGDGRWHQLASMLHALDFADRNSCVA